MATIQNEIVVVGLSGILGEQLAIHRNHAGQLEIRAIDSAPNQSGYGDEPDRHHRQLYEALLCPRTAPSVANDEVMKPCSEATALALAADVIHAPEIHSVDLTKYTGHAGENIRIIAGDDARIASVGLLIVTDEGVLIENGAARVSDQDPYVWTYITAANVSSRFVKIVVDVADIAPRDDSAETVN